MVVASDFRRMGEHPFFSPLKIFVFFRAAPRVRAAGPRFVGVRPRSHARKIPTSLAPFDTCK
jgi:hypothetical protein